MYMPYENLSGNKYLFRMAYHQQFFSLRHAAKCVAETVRNDFVFNLGAFLTTRLKTNDNTACAVANSLYERMSASHLHYHSPLRILSIFSFAKQYRIELMDWEHLAIWFQNAIHEVNAPFDMNQSQSAAFMRAVLPTGHQISDNQIMNFADRAIIALSKHFSGTPEEGCYRILDLDLHHLAMPAETFQQALDCMSKEVCAVASLRRFKSRYRAVLERFSKRNIFRTSYFIENFESAAQRNAANALVGLT